jgi:serine protease Do
VNGELIGINTAIVSGGGGGNQGVGFAVPVNMARNVMDQIMKNGKVTRGYLGVSAQTVTGDIATSFGLTGTPRGALVGDVASDSPASKAGLQKGDIILQLNGEPIADSRSLSLKVSSLAPNTQAHLQIWRQGKEQDVTATLAELPATAGTANREASGNNGSPALGISVETLTEPLARRLGLPAQTKGAVIDEVQSGSRADDAGLKQGDVVEEVNHKSIATADDFENAVRAGENQPVLLLVNRGGNHVYVVIERQ